MGSKLTDNNPNIADLSDENRPTKLAELYSELYDNEWTNAYESLEDSRPEVEVIEVLLDTLTVMASVHHINFCFSRSKYPL